MTPTRITSLIDLVVCPDRLQEDGLGPLVLDELENYPQVVPGATGPRTRQFSREFVCLQRRLESILRQ